MGMQNRNVLVPGALIGVSISLNSAVSLFVVQSVHCPVQFNKQFAALNVSIQTVDAVWSPIGFLCVQLFVHFVCSDKTQQTELQLLLYLVSW